MKRQMQPNIYLFYVLYFSRPPIWLIRSGFDPNSPTSNSRIIAQEIRTTGKRRVPAAKNREGRECGPGALLEGKELRKAREAWRCDSGTKRLRGGLGEKQARRGRAFLLALPLNKSGGFLLTLEQHSGCCEGLPSPALGPVRRLHG